MFKEQWSLGEIYVNKKCKIIKERVKVEDL